MKKSIKLPYWDLVGMDEFRAECCEQDREGVITIETHEPPFLVVNFYPVTRNGLFENDKYPPYYDEHQRALCNVLKVQCAKYKAKKALDQNQ